MKARPLYLAQLSGARSYLVIKPARNCNSSISSVELTFVPVSAIPAGNHSIDATGALFRTRRRISSRYGTMQHWTVAITISTKLHCIENRGNFHTLTKYSRHLTKCSLEKCRVSNVASNLVGFLNL